MNATDPHPPYRINEIFYSLQGEGFHTGTPCVFLRFAGCNRRCSFCDTDFTTFRPMTIEEIISATTTYPSRRIVCTGGEPLLQLDQPLIEALHGAGFTIAIETNGTLPVPQGIDWVTCSPKSPPLAKDRIDELKIVYTGVDTDPEEIAATLPHAAHHFLQPLSQPHDPAITTTSETIRYILAHPRWRLSLQTHKLLHIP